MIERRLVSRPVSTIGTLIAPRVTQQEGPPIVTQGLVLHLDAGNPYSYLGTGTTWTDLSGSGNTGTLNNGPTFSADRGGAISCDGTNDYISVSGASGNLSWTPSGSGFNSMTVEIMVNTTDTGGWFISKPWNQNGRYNYQLSTDYFAVGMTGVWDGTPGMSKVSFSSTLATGNWEHAVGVVTPTQSGIYRNGVADGSMSSHGITANSPDNGNENLSLAVMTLFPYTTTFNQPTHAINGRVAVVRIYNRALSAAEVFQNYQATRWRFGI